jgi:hypothetical protein
LIQTPPLTGSFLGQIFFCIHHLIFWKAAAALEDDVVVFSLISSLRIWESKSFSTFFITFGSSAHTGLVGLTRSSLTCSSDFICCSNWSWMPWDWLIDWFHSNKI